MVVRAIKIVGVITVKNRCPLQFLTKLDEPEFGSLSGAGVGSGVGATLGSEVSVGVFASAEAELSV